MTFSNQFYFMWKFFFQENSIEQIPYGIERLGSLKHFSLANNKLKKIPKSLANITKLKGKCKKKQTYFWNFFD